MDITSGEQATSKIKEKRKTNVAGESKKPTRKQQAMSKWKENSEFDRVIQSEPFGNICDNFPEMLKGGTVDIFSNLYHRNT